MPLRITSAPVSGVKKRKNPALSRPRASPFATHARRKLTASPGEGAKGKNVPVDEDLGPLPDIGVSHYIPETTTVQNVVQAIEYILDHMFEELPARRAGMNSTHIAETLNLRRSLPPLASVAHVHTLLNAPTKVEKEIMELIHTGQVRRLTVPGRGNDAAGLGDCLVLVKDWERLVRQSGLEPELKDKFLLVLSRLGNTSAVSGALFSPPEYMALIRAGFLVSSSSLSQGSSGLLSLPNFQSTSSAGNSASRSDCTHHPPRNADHRPPFHTATLFLSLPNIGPYLRLLGAARGHLLSLLQRSSSSEIPLDLLRDRWDGAVETDRSFSVAKRVRGEFAGILPGRTKKWKDLYGMSFRWVLEEALGAGLVEIFDTGAVGPGVRGL
ncbi:serine-threonine protein kinase 19-domain-containing protein [Aspergillus ambiguus]|uniref:Stk19 family serine/threonine-protein kinase n=1 Tax=Aspergillus ambiguus TaxID=176160 RepID=UPI003CCDF198